MLTTFKTKLRKFRRDETGSIIAETAIMMPTLFAAVMATYVFFDAYRNQAVNLKANYTISDAFSRESQVITDTFITNSWFLHRYLTKSPSLTSLRVSVVQYDEDNDRHDVVWSRGKGDSGGDVTWGELSEISMSRNQIPLMRDAERLIVVQTAVDYAPKFLIGITDFTFEDMIFTRPRIAQGLCYSSDGNPDNRICPLDSV